MKRIILWITASVFLIYIFVGIIVNLTIPLHWVKSCPPCPKGLWCAPCWRFEEGIFTIKDMATVIFWKNVVYWPENVLEHREFLKDIEIGKTVRI